MAKNDRTAEDLYKELEYEENANKSVESVQIDFSDEQKAYIENTPPEERRAQDSLNIHFHQLQEPVSFAIIVPKKEKRQEVLPEVEFEKEEDTGRKKKTTRKKAHKGYPKEYFDPTDREFEPKDGKTYVYFNVEKSLRKYHLTKITKIIPIAKLEKWTYDKAFFDKIAEKQHAKAEKLNALSADKQYKRDWKVRLIALGSVTFVFLLGGMYIKSVYLPNKAFEKGGNLMAAEKYDEAYYEFNKLGTRDNAHVYAKYCEGQMQIKTEHYDKAKECFTLLLDYQNLFANDISIEKMVQKCDYLKAKDLYNAEDFEGAKALFKSVYQYEDATTYYYKCSCEIADSYYVNGDYYTAIDSMYEAGNAGYEDAHNRLLNMADELYNKGRVAYDDKNYEEAQKIFKFLSEYKFKDSKDRYTQCSYNAAMEKFTAGNYTEAETSFNRISEYKDSVALMKESTYNLAQQTAYDNPVKSIKLYEKIKDYKDANEILTGNRLVLYGRWNITELNDSKITPIEFSFYDGGLFYTKTQISGVAISTDATPQSYIWINDHFSAIEDTYQMSIEVNESSLNTQYSVNDLTLICTYNDNTYRYRCERTMSYTEMLKADNTVKDTEETTLTLNQMIEQEIKAYISKKTDGYIVLDGEQVEVTGKGTRLMNGLGEANREESSESEAEKQ